MRENCGAGILAKLALEKVKDGENYVFTSIRNPKEVELLQTRKDFVLVNVTSSESSRLKRIIARNREEDPKTLKQLREKETRENGNDPNSQQLNTVAKMAKIIFKNDSALEVLETKVRKLVGDWLYKLQDERP